MRGVGSYGVRAPIQRRLSPYLSKQVVTFGEKLDGGLKIPSARNANSCPLKTLKAVAKHGAIFFFEDVVADLDYKVGTHTENVPIERGVVELAQRKTVGNDGLAARVPVREDVGGVEKLRMPQPTHCALFAVGSEHSLTK